MYKLTVYVYCRDSVALTRYGVILYSEVELGVTVNVYALTVGSLNIEGSVSLCVELNFRVEGGYCICGRCAYALGEAHAHSPCRIVLGKSG